MKTIFHILKRDFARLFRTPAALIVVAVLCVLPSLYTWYNVLGFWNPYENTGNLKVAVSNLDAGGTSELTGELHVGDTIVEALQGNDQLDWVFMTEDEGMAALEAGEVYALFIIPEDFTGNLLSITTGHFTKPNLFYYVNEKTGPVAPKITNAGAGVLESTINATFVQTVSDVVVGVLSDVLEESDTLNATLSADTLADIERTRELIVRTKDSLAVISGLTADIRGSITAARSALADGAAKLEEMDAALGNVPDDAAAAKLALEHVSGNLSGAIGSLGDALGALSALDEGDVPLDDDAAAQIRAIAKALEDSSGVLMDQTMAALYAGIDDMQVAADAITLTVHMQQLMVNQAFATLNRLGTTLDMLDRTVEATSSLLDEVDADLSRLHTAVQSATATSVLSQLVSDTGLDFAKVSEFLGKPTRVETRQLYPLSAYGSAMAPLFMNLTFWIGAFMMMVVLRIDADEEGIKRMGLAARYLGRLLFMAVIAIIQALVCCAGVLAIGVQAASVPALLAAAVCASLAYLCVIYCLVMSMRHVGKALAIILAFIQIPGATGLYPIEMTSVFFQTVFRFLPFTYGIKAMREAIFGFYGNQYAQALLMLAFFAVTATVLGILLTRVMANMNRLFAREMRENGVFNEEAVLVRGDARPFTRLISAFSTDEVEELRARAQRAERIYPAIMKVALVGGILVPVIAAAIFALNSGEKTVLLTGWLVWLVVVCVTLVAVENWRSNAASAFAEAAGAGTAGAVSLPPAPPAAAAAGAGEPEAGEDAEGEEAGEGERSFDSAASGRSAQDGTQAGTRVADPQDDAEAESAAASPAGPHYATVFPGYTSIVSGKRTAAKPRGEVPRG